MRVLVLGSGGQVGAELMRGAWPAGVEAVGRPRAELDVRDPAAVEAELSRSEPGLVVNAAAYTQVDGAEAEPEAAFAVNRDAPGRLAGLCAARGVPLLHLSTDYVFDGRGGGPDGYAEDEPPAPLGIYGRSKAEGEAAVRAAHGRHVILRTSWVFGAVGRNFVKTVLRLAAERDELRIVADQHGGPTAAADVAATVAAVAARVRGGAMPWGTFHFAGRPTTTWHGLADAIVALAAPVTGRRPAVRPIATGEYPTPARRPARSVLDTSRLARTCGIGAPDWRPALARVLAELGA